MATCIFFQIEQSFSCPIRPQINIPFLPAVRFPIPFSYENISSSVLLVIFFLPLALNPLVLSVAPQSVLRFSYFQDMLRIAPLKNPMLLLHLHSPETAHSGYPSEETWKKEIAECQEKQQAATEQITELVDEQEKQKQLLESSELEDFERQSEPASVSESDTKEQESEETK